MNELSLFSGAGGGLLATQHLLGFRTVCYVEIDDYCQRVLQARIQDGLFDDAPIWDDVRTFDGRPWRGCVDLVTAGFPCQDISSCGSGEGLNGKKSGLWREVARIVREVRPRLLFLENSPLLVGRGLVRILGELAEMGFDARWCVLSAGQLGAPHLRNRVWLLANTDSSGLSGAQLPVRPWQQGEGTSESVGYGQALADASRHGLEGAVHMENRKATNEANGRGASSRGTLPACWEGDHPEPGVLGMDDWMANWRNRIAACGEGQVPIVAATAFRILIE